MADFGTWDLGTVHGADAQTKSLAPVNRHQSISLLNSSRKKHVFLEQIGRYPLRELVKKSVEHGFRDEMRRLERLKRAPSRKLQIVAAILWCRGIGFGLLLIPFKSSTKRDLNTPGSTSILD